MSDIQDIPFLDLVTPHRELNAELTGVFQGALATAGFIGGPAVQKFETEFAAFCGTSHCVGVSSGTDALRFALIAAGVENGDAVITVSNTFIATTEAISQAGALPIFVDIDEATYNMDPVRLREYLESGCEFDRATRTLLDKRSGRRITAIVPVHLYGQMADMDPILDLAAEYKLIVIEDACQAHGAEYFSKRDNSWHRAGSMGVAAAFSFYPGKNLGACGEGGAATTGDAAIAARMRMLRDHGQVKKYYHDIEGYNGRLDAIQAGILSVKLKHLEDWNAQRRAAAARYHDLLASAEEAVIRPVTAQGAKHVHHLYVIRVQEREELMKYLAEHRIGTAIHYPIPLHQQKAYAQLDYRAGSLPVTERVAPEIVSLPMFPGLAEAQQMRVAERVLEFACQRVHKV